MDTTISTETFPDDFWVEETRVPKSKWAPGPWHNEPDKVSWHDADTDMACLMVRARTGNWCGYVGVPPGHPWHGKKYDVVDADVHGGLTYSDFCHGPICHTPAPGQPADVYWLGFDCAHAWDLSPGLQALLATLPHTAAFFTRDSSDIYRDMDYVRGEVLGLAQQARAATK